MRLVEKLKEKSRSKKFIINCTYFTLYTIFCFSIYQNIKGQQFFSNEKYQNANLLSLTPNESIEVIPNLKTDCLYKYQIPFTHDESINISDFKYDIKTNKIYTVEIQNADSSNSYFSITFPEPAELKKINFSCNKEIKLPLDAYSNPQSRQYGLPQKYCKIFLLISISICLSVYFIVNLINKIIKTVAIKYLIFNILLGIGFIIVLPPYISPDEGYHVNTAYDFSNILLGKDSYKNSSKLLMRNCDRKIFPPETTKKLNTIENISAVYKKPHNYKKYYPYLISSFQNEVTSDEDYHEINGRIADRKRYIYYVPHALGITLARIMNWNQFILYYLSCFFALTFNTLILFIAYIKTKCKNPLFYFLGMGALLIQQMSHFTYDGMIYTLAMGFIIFYISYYQKKNTSDLIFSIIYLLLLYPAKNHIYISLSLIFLTPYLTQIKNLFIKNKRIFITTFLTILSIFFILYIHYINTNPSLYAICYRNVFDSYQISNTTTNILVHPISYVLKIFSTSNEILLPKLLELINLHIIETLDSFIIIPYLYLLYRTLIQKETYLADRKLKIMLAIIIFIVFNGILYGMYLSEGAKAIIDRVPARYFIGILIPIFLVFNTPKIRLGKEYDESELIFHSTILLNFLLLIDLFLIIIR